MIKLSQVVKILVSVFKFPEKIFPLNGFFGWTDGWMDGVLGWWKNEWMDGCIKILTRNIFNSFLYDLCSFPSVWSSVEMGKLCLKFLKVEVFVLLLYLCYSSSSLSTYSGVDFNIEELLCQAPWITSVILATRETEIRRIAVQSQPKQIVPQDPILKNPAQERACGVAQGEGPEFKPQYHKKKKRKTALKYPYHRTVGLFFPRQMGIHLYYIPCT
jgi:hypothetical protein